MKVNIFLIVFNIRLNFSLNIRLYLLVRKLVGKCK